MFMAVWGRIRLLVLNQRESIEVLPTPGRSRRLLPLLVFLYAGSGCAALVYEIVWFQLLQLVIGSSAVSLGLLLAAYMGGLCVGSALLPRAISREYQPLRVYAVLELGIGVLGLAVLFGLPLIGRMYVATATQGLIGLVERGIIAALCLLPPTVLMGASLPAIARWVETTSEGVSWMGLMYSGNIAGAVFGCLLAGFYLLRVHDMAIATYVAVAINAAVALISFLASRIGRGRSDSRAKRQPARSASAITRSLENRAKPQEMAVAPAVSPLAALRARGEKADKRNCCIDRDCNICRNGHVVDAEQIKPGQKATEDSTSDVGAVHQTHPGNTFGSSFDPSRNRRQRSSHKHGGRQ